MSPRLAVIAHQETCGWQFRPGQTLEQRERGGRQWYRTGPSLAAECHASDARIELAPCRIYQLTSAGAGQHRGFKQIPKRTAACGEKRTPLFKVQIQVTTLS